MHACKYHILMLLICTKSNFSFHATAGTQPSPLCVNIHQGQDLFIWEKWGPLIMTTGTGDLPLITESGWCRSFSILDRNTSPAVIICWLHYVLLANSFWHFYRTESHSLVFIALLLFLSLCLPSLMIWQENIQPWHVYSHLASFAAAL